MSRPTIGLVALISCAACGARSDLLVPRDGGFVHAPVVRVAVGLHHRCFLLADETVWCAGDNDRGQLGDGTRTSRLRFGPVTGLGGVVQLALGSDHSCARLRDQSVWCWGDGSAGQSGTGDLADRLAPERVPGMDGVIDLASGGATLCAARADGSVWCWGADETRQLGRAANSETCPRDPSPWRCGRLPRSVAGLGPDVVSISSGPTRMCALTSGGDVWCWGMTGEGEPGNEYCPPHAWERCAATPWRIAWPAVRSIATGGNWTCALGEVGEVRCTRVGIAPLGPSPDWLAGAGRFLLAGASGSVMVSGEGISPQTSTVARPVGVTQAASLSTTCLLTDGHEVWCAPAPHAEMERVNF